MGHSSCNLLNDVERSLTVEMNFSLHPRRVGKILIVVAILIAIFSLISEYLVEVLFVADDASIRVMLLDLLSVNLEDSIPTWYSIILLFVATLLLFIIAYSRHQASNRYARHWLGLGVLFFYLSMDEGAVIHEIFAEPLQLAFGTSGVLAFGWQILAGPLVILFGILYLRFLFYLPKRTRFLFVIAGGLYVGGALVVEGFSAALWEANNGVSMTYLIVATLEELFEILGVSIFIYALLDYMMRMGISLRWSYDVPTDLTRWDDGDEDMPSHSTGVKNTSKRIHGSMILAIVFLLLTNVASFAWILADRPVVSTGLRAVTLPFYAPLQSEFDSLDVVILELPEVFTIDSVLPRRLANDLLLTYREVTVVAFPTESRSVLFAGDHLPFDNTQLTELLHANGTVEFIIYDTDVVSLFTSNLE